MITTIQKGQLEYLAAEGIGVPHGFTTRRGGVSTGHLASLNVSQNRGDDPENVRENFRRIGNAIGFDPMALILSKQTHSDMIRRVGRRDWGGYMTSGVSPVCDGLITNEPGTALMISIADCTPILLWDPVTGAVGAVHAGWRGTSADIAGKAVRAMAAEFGTEPENIRSAIGASIGPCCFETDAEVPQALIAAFGPEAAQFCFHRGEKYFPDLKAINALALKRAGVTHIEISGECTMCAPDKFWSHRYTRGLRGTQGAFIVCKGVSI